MIKNYAVHGRVSPRSRLPQGPHLPTPCRQAEYKAVMYRLRYVPFIGLKLVKLSLSSCLCPALFGTIRSRPESARLSETAQALGRLKKNPFA